MSTCSSNLDLIYFEDQPEGPLWLLSIFLLVSSSSGQSDIFDPLFCFCPHLRWDSWSTAPPNSPSFSYLIFQRSVGSCAAGQFCFSVFIHPPPPTFNLPSFCFFPPPLLLLFLSLSLVQDQGLTAPVSGDRGRDHLVRGASLLILPNSGRL